MDLRSGGPDIGADLVGMRPPLNGFREPATGKRVIRSHCSRFSIDPCLRAVIFGLLLITLSPVFIYTQGA
ncbi:hypothetical protein ASPVEDRAFT_46509 [Aspergillus versicolor CBS 583.65]|uniref:Uncharacterized protein n=1 Tax=Aspergillus versicolor CBS 583.65 TaxID=1036611 RepID=A0A1L9Q089_ASPVE|nr:uncharacterized protein ASPVEDRAFT_46509 [Aspergillus versicolor CBS 583.65]OJJ07126.1 hypothetical protein ASPVEDRAFT_46509 [Aspergillus versicolor CBS 583.65]